MRPSGDTGNFVVSTKQKDGRIQVVVDALDKDDEFLNFLDIQGALVDPTMDAKGVSLRQTAPGRYVGEFEAGRSGSYFLTLNAGPGQPPIRTGMNIGYSEEFRDRETNQALLESLASLEPKGGAPGQIIPVSLTDTIVALPPETNTFRRDVARTVSSNYIWPWLVLISSCIFFGDVFIRRVAVEFGWLFKFLARARDWILRREPEAKPDERMNRLRSRKAAVTETIDQRRAQTRFEPEPDQEIDTSILDEGATAAPTDVRRDVKTTDMGPGAKEEDDFATRLMKAKQQALRKDQRRPNDDR
jgi:hypothetical protein